MVLGAKEILKKITGGIQRMGQIGIPDVVRKSDEKIITLREVSKHDSPDDCWIVLFNRVYDVTPFLSQHPGGMEVIFENAGRDATIAFQDAGHSALSLTIMEHYKKGILPESERLHLKTFYLTTAAQPYDLSL